MTMECNFRRVGDVTIIDLKGRLSLDRTIASGPGSDLVLPDAVRQLADSGEKKILLNLAGVWYVDSSGVGQLARALATARNHGVALKLLRPVREVLDLLNMAKLTTVFDVQDDEAKAIDSFSATAAVGAPFFLAE